MAMQQNAGYFQWYPSTDFNTLLTRGCDISQFQYPVNFNTMYSAGARFVYQKAGGNIYNFYTARYVRVSVNGNSAGASAIFRELKVYDTSSVERATGKTVTTSSGVNGAAFTDGNTSTEVNVGNGYQWIKVDLGASYNIRYFVLNMYPNVTFFEKKVEYSTDNVNWTTIYDATDADTGNHLEKTGGMMVITAATSGFYAKNSQMLAANITAARAAGLKIGFYWFKNPNYYDVTAKAWKNTIADAEAEADLFKSYIDAELGGADWGDIMPMLDWENNLGNIYPAVTDDQAYNFIEAFVNRFKATTGRQVILYSAFYTNDNLDTTPNQLVHSADGGIGNICPLWLSAMYGSGTYPSYNYTAFGGFTNNRWTIWQYSTDGNGLASTYGASGTDIDLNHVEDLDNILKPVAPSGFGATAGNTQVTLNWTEIPNDAATGYKIYRDGNLVQTITNKATVSYIDTGLNNGQQYSYTIKTTTRWEDSAASSAQLATPTNPVPQLFPYYPQKTRAEVVSGNWDFTGNVDFTGANTHTGQETFTKFQASSDVKIFPTKYGFNNTSTDKYMRILRLKFVANFGRIMLRLPLVHTGTNTKFGTLNAFFYESTLGTINAASNIFVVNDTGLTQGFAAGNIKYQQWKTAGLNPDYIDIWTLMDDFATFGYFTNMIYTENQSSIIFNPDNATTANGVGLQASIPIAGATDTYEGNAVTAQAPVDVAIKTITMT